MKKETVIPEAKKRKVIDEFDKFGYSFDLGTRFYYNDDLKEWGAQVGHYTHSCHIETTDIIVLLFPSGDVKGFADYWLNKMFII